MKLQMLEYSDHRIDVLTAQELHQCSVKAMYSEYLLIEIDLTGMFPKPVDDLSNQLHAIILAKVVGNK